MIAAFVKIYKNLIGRKIHIKRSFYRLYRYTIGINIIEKIPRMNCRAALCNPDMTMTLDLIGFRINSYMIGQNFKVRIR